MSLYGTIQLSGNALRAQDIGLQVVGQNIANANTPGYIREDLNLVPGATQRQGSLLLGLGVRAAGITQQVDKLLEERLRAANSDVAGASTQQQSLQQLEGLLGDLGKTDLGTTLNKFFSSIQDILNQPESVTTRNLAVLRGQTLTQDINALSNRVGTISSGVDQEIVSAASDINRLTKQIRDLNVQITQLEGGSGATSDAVGLRDQRQTALKDLSNLINIRVAEQPSGGVAVYAGGDYLVFDGQVRTVSAQQKQVGNQSQAYIQLDDTQAPLEFSSGKLFGLLQSRDSVYNGFLDKLDSLSKSLAYEFNRVYSSGQGLNGYQNITSENAVDATNKPLDAVGLANAPTNGSFQFIVRDKTSGLSKSTTINVDLNGLDHDTSISDLAAKLNAVAGIQAIVTPQRQLSIQTTAANQEFSFSNDTSGVLASLGINTFFSGSNAASLAINKAVVSDPSKFAASSGGIGEDTKNAVDLAGFLDRPLDTQNGNSLGTTLGNLTSGVTQASAGAASLANGYQVYQQALQGQSLAVSGVSIDEEAIKMLAYQHAYQASAKVISTVKELLNVLINL
jgi:flagellar hook-associated protein 1 FlgK